MVVDNKTPQAEALWYLIMSVCRGIFAFCAKLIKPEQFRGTWFFDLCYPCKSVAYSFPWRTCG
jgi:hypothetical protein